MYILLRSCGGLGNQLFQAHYALLLQGKNSSSRIFHFHSTNYSRHAEWELHGMPFESAPWYFKFILAFRLPQVFYRLGWSRTESLRFFNLFLLDGYFLDSKEYFEFSKEELTATQYRIKKALNLDAPPAYPLLLHLRLGDFWENANQKHRFLDSTFTLQAPSTEGAPLETMTNEEEFVEAYLREHGLDRVWRIVPTRGYTGLELLRRMMSYKLIRYNGSTLAFWAAVFSGASLQWQRCLDDHHYVTQNCMVLDRLREVYGVDVTEMND